MEPIKELRPNSNLTISFPDSLKEIREFVGEDNFCLTGSRIVCTPPILHTYSLNGKIPNDFDIVLYYPHLFDGSNVLQNLLQKHDFKLSTSDSEDYENFICYRSPNSDVNFIIVYKQEKFQKWIVATRLAKAMNLREKSQRILLFKYIMNGSEDF